jgi:hypothetical protein
MLCAVTNRYKIPAFSRNLAAFYRSVVKALTTTEETVMPNRAVIKVVEDRPFLVCTPEDTVQLVAG